MIPGFTEILSTGASIGGDLLNFAGVNRTNSSNKGIARENMEFQERMSNSAYTRAMADMKNAGLNPMLAYKQGGASAPPGAMATMQNPMSSFSNSAAKALAMSLTKADIANKIADTKLKTDQAATAWSLGQLYDTQTQGAMYDNAGKKVEADFMNNAGHWWKVLQKGGTSAKDAKSISDIFQRRGK